MNKTVSTPYLAVLTGLLRLVSIVNVANDVKTACESKSDEAVVSPQWTC